MSNKMLIDAIHPEETRVVVMRDKRVEDFDFEAASKKPLRGNIYLAKVTRVEPSLQAAFVEYGGNRHGFLAFSEIHPDYYQIPQADRAALLADERVAEEEEPAPARTKRRRSRSKGAAAKAEAAVAEETASEPAATQSAPSEDAASEPVEVIEEPAEAPAETAAEVTADAEAAPASDTSAEADAGDDNPTSDMEAAAPAPADAAPVDDEAPGEAAEATLAESGEEASAADASTADAAEEEKPAPKRPTRRRRTTSKTTKKSDDGLADPVVSDDQDADDGASEVTSLGNSDVMEEIPERRRSNPKKTYKIQEVIRRRQILLVQVVKEERGTKGAALTTYLSLAGRYSVLMPNTDRGGGVSRKITDASDRNRLKGLVAELEVPEGMGIILRTAGASRTKTEIRRDFEYLIRLWESVRDLTLQSIAPALVYEEGNLVKRAIRDLYSKEIDEVLVSGEAAYREAKDFMRMLMPSHAKNVKAYREPTPIFTAFGIEAQLDAMFSPEVTLPSKGYIVINPTEALVSIDVNSGRSTKEHSIEETALKTNLEAADEVARQLRLRDLAGLIVIDFIDMDERRHNRAVEKRLKDALKLDRSRIQVGRISPFGLLEMSRQRIRQGMVETSMVPCPVCGGTGMVRSTSSVALHCLRSLEEHLLKHADRHVTIKTSSGVALYILNQKRAHLHALEERFGLQIGVDADETLSGQHMKIEAGTPVEREPGDVPPTAQLSPDAVAVSVEDEDDEVDTVQATEDTGNGDRSSRRRRRRRRRGGSDEGRDYQAGQADAAGEDDADTTEIETEVEAETPVETAGEPATADGGDGDEARGRRRRGRRGGRRHRREGDAVETTGSDENEASDEEGDAPDQEVAPAEAVSEPVVAEAVAVPDGVIEVPIETPQETAAVSSEAEAVVPDEAQATSESEDAVTAAQVPVEEAESTTAEASPETATETATDTETKTEESDEARPRRVGWWQRRSFF
ncbi:Rne/Rng family ribonuclease [Acuticoccus mangrovi]|uniref:Ribonuclease E n=1 Tax=Acuticoccus mangrovi TaxID=2796142 RepID=A0A934IE00_9HYPH|nr:ribonuclease E/G [Acuticoccus mangrovi]MBJ3774798.1 Rne/Rng family ribonuclease [Acuticoccus mangrovi]